jgi:alpha-tubulin suppressor-like RCC1 family protein
MLKNIIINARKTEPGPVNEIWGVGISLGGALDNDVNYYRYNPHPTDSTWVSASHIQSLGFAIKDDGTLWGWGANSQGNLGVGDTAYRSSPVQIGTNTDWYGVNVGTNSFGIKTDGTLWVWGPTNTTMGISGSVSRSSPVQIGTDTNWAYIDNGNNFVTALKTDGTRWAWGTNGAYMGAGHGLYYFGQVFRGNFVSASIDTQFNTGIKPDGTLWSWGINTNGQLGLNTGATLTISFPTQVGTDTNWKSVTSTNGASVAVKTDGTLWGWGRNDTGKLGLGDLINRSSPTQVGTDTNWKTASTSNSHTMAVKTDGTLWGWGSNLSGEIGIGVTAYDIFQIGTDTDWYDIDVSNGHIIAIKEVTPGDGYGTLWAWGGNSSGQLGQNDVVTRSSPTQIGTLTNWKQVSAGINRSFAIKTDGTIWSWGLGTSGALGLPNTVNRSSPTQIGTLSNWSLVSTNTENTTHAIKTDGTLWAWGSNGNGQFGNGTKTSTFSPVQIGTKTDWVKVANAQYATFALDSSNGFYAAGFNGAGDLGIGTTTERTGFGLDETDVVEIAAHTRGGFLIKTDGSIWSWGLNSSGQLGINDTINRSFKTQIGTDTDWSEVDSFANGVMAKKTDNTIWGWGNVDIDRIITSRSSPTQIGTLSNWSKFSAGNDSQFMTNTSGELYGFAGSSHKALGLIDPTLSSPVQVGVSNDWDYVDVGTGYTVGLKTDGTIWSWGANVFTRTDLLGQNYGTLPILIASPTQIGTETNWATISNSNTHTIVKKTDNTIWGWGDNSNSQGGAPIPTRIGTLSNWASAHALNVNSIFVDNDGYAWMQGSNNSGQFGLGAIGSNVTPMQKTYLGSPITNVASSKISNRVGIMLDGMLWTAGETTTVYLGWENGIIREPIKVFGETWSELKTGGNYTIGIKGDGTLWGWGLGNNGVLGLGDIITRSLPTQIGTESDWYKIQATNSSYGIKTNGTLWGWGPNSSGQLGVNDLTPRSSPVQIGTKTNWDSLFGETSSATIFGTDTTGSLWGWGDNSVGQFGLGQYDLTNRSLPTQITSLGSNPKTVINIASETVAISNSGRLYTMIGGLLSYRPISPVLITNKSSWQSVYVGKEFPVVLAIDDENALWAWGDNSREQLGFPYTNLDDRELESPVQVGTLKNWSSISIGASYTMAVKTDGTLWSWGNNANGVLGDDTTLSKSSPVQIGTLTDWANVYAGVEVSYAIKTDGTLWGWGRGTYNPFNDTINRSSPVQVGTETNWATLATAAITPSVQINHTTLAIKTDGTLWTWGYDDFGLSGLNTVATSRSSPVQVGFDSNWSKVDIGRSNAMAIKTDGSVWGWGLGSNLGNAKVASLHSQIDTSTNNVSVDGYGSTVTVLKTDGTLWSWGTVVGNNLVVASSTPIQIDNGTWTGFSQGSATVIMALKSDGTLWGWGSGTFGQLGQNDVVSRSSPVQVGTDTNWYDVSTGSAHSLSIKTDGTLWAWGIGTSGQLGQNNALSRSSPVQVGTDANWSDISAGNNTSIAIKTDGTIWAWGAGTNGVLGLGNTINRSSPTQIGTLSNWLKISVGASHTMSIKTNGTLWAWGVNTGGRLGDNTSISRSSPVQIGTLTNWTDVYAGADSTIAKRNDGTVWAWGTNTTGKLGDNTIITRSSPVQIGTTGSWNVIHAGTNSFLIGTDGGIYGAGGTTTALTGYIQYAPTVNRSSPILLNASTGWNSIWLAENASVLKNDGTLWAWGRNTNLTIGDPNTTNGVIRSIPIQIGTDTNWTSAPVGQNIKLGIKSY